MDKTAKKPWYKRKLTWIGAIILLFIIIAASSSGDTPTKIADTDQPNDNQSGTTDGNTTPEKTDLKVGDVISFDGKEVTVASVERNWNSGNQFIVPDSGNEFVKVQVTIANKSKSEASYNTFDWQVQDSNGVIKDVASATYSVDGALGSGTLASNGKVSGFLVFEVPADDSGLILKYSPSFWTDKKVEIKL